MTHEKARKLRWSLRMRAAPLTSKATERFRLSAISCTRLISDLSSSFPPPPSSAPLSETRDSRDSTN